MTQRLAIATHRAPSAIGTYSQGIRVGDLLFVSGQIPLHPETMELVEGPVERQIERIFDNIAAVVEAAGGSLQECVKLTVYLTDLADFGAVNTVMEQRFRPPFPARAVVQVSQLPKAAAVEVDAIVTLA